MSEEPLSSRFISLPKAELHVHLEGSVRPATACEIAAEHGINVTAEEVALRYGYRNFAEFIEAFKWVTSLLSEPRDYGKVMRDLGEQLLAQNVVYAEITLSIGVMLLRKQRVEDNFAAILEAARSFLERGLHIHFIFDAVRQFGVDAAMRVVESAEQCEQQCRSSASATSAANSIVAFGIGGDELSAPAGEFRVVYDRAAEIGLHKLMHAGEIGGPQEIRDAIELLDVERIGHGIAAIRDPALMDLLADRRIPLEICPQSNIKTGALARQLDVASANIEQHPMAKLFRHGIPVVLSTDDPAMFHTGLLDEYRHARRLGLNEEELTRMADMSFEYGFMNNVERSRSGGSSAV